VRTIGVVTTSRADYGILRPVLRAIEAHPELHLRLYVSGSHLLERHGMTVRGIEADGFPIAERLETLTGDDTPQGITASMALGTREFGAAFARSAPDLLVVLGDRYEMHAAAVAALPFTVPLAHLHGGEVTEGAIDEALRHGITKMSHLHFPATGASADRIAQLGEERWRITVAGAPSLDNLREIEILDRSALGISPDRPFLLVTYHPMTLEPEHAGERAQAVLDALRDVDADLVITAPNADTGREAVMRRIEAFVAERRGANLLTNAGTQRYFSLMAHAAAMVGNSSSGIIEAASFGLPVVNVGIRQRGRLRARNVIDTPENAQAIRAAVDQAISPAFREATAVIDNPYGDGHASERIATRLAEVPLDTHLLHKHFHDLTPQRGQTP
jgi:UDP-hydrolysing UDP-N-acetyl-D-glucosamine 2-epimerase